MAAGGGHWIKVASGPYAGKLTFVPALHGGTFQKSIHSGTGMAKESQTGIIQGGLAVHKSSTGEWTITHTESGLYLPYSYKNKAAALAAMDDLNQSGVKWTAKESELNLDAAGQVAKNIKAKYQGLNANDVGKVHKSAAEVQAEQKGKPFTGKKQPVPKIPEQKGEPVQEPGVKTTPKAASAQNIATQTKAATQAASSSAAAAYKSQADFDGNAKDVTITTMMGKSEVVKGVLIGDGSLGVTLNPKTGQYHVVDAVSGKTISKYNTAEQAFSGAAAESKNMVSIQPPGNNAYKFFDSANAGHAAMVNGYKNQPLPSDAVSAIKKYQGSPSVNDVLWKDGTSHPNLAGLDKAMSKAKLPQDTILVRGQSSGHPLYKFAKVANVGDTYQAKGFDSTSVNPSHSWGGNSVKVIYRAPKGIKAVYCNAYGHEAYSHEYEVLLGRRLQWNVIGKTVHNGNITLTLDYAGEW